MLNVVFANPQFTTSEYQLLGDEIVKQDGMPNYVIFIS